MAKWRAMNPEVSYQWHTRWPVLWLCLLLVAAILLPHRIWNALLIAFGGVYGVAWFWVRQMGRHVRATRQVRQRWVAVGDHMEEVLTLTNGSWLPALWVELVDHSNLPGYEARVVQSIDPQQQFSWRQTAVCRQRGQFTLGPWELVSGDPFGIFGVTQRYAVSEEIIIHPPIHEQLPIPLPSGRHSGQRRMRQRSWEATINAASVRDYQPSDPLRWVHWPSSAKRQALQVRQFDLDAGGDMWLLVDMEARVQLGEGLAGTEEQAVLLAASLASLALQRQRAVGLAAYGRRPQILHPSQGAGQEWHILRALALAKADGQTSLGRALADVGQLTQRDTALVIITPNLEPDWLPEVMALARRGFQPTAVLFDRASFGGDGAAEGLRSLLRQWGEVHLVRHGQIRQAVEITDSPFEYKVTPLGKVIAKRRVAS